ncbi:MAG: hypothetical protein ACRD1S_17115 [Vicinamibacterales bacterium]
MKRTSVLVLVALAAAASSGCLVLALHPAHEDASITWDQALVGTWVNEDDRVTATVGRGEWRSYRIEYEHPIEKGTLTGYLTTLGDRNYLDISPVRGQDHGSFLLPVHALLRVERQADTLTVQALDYDRFAIAAKQGGLLGLPMTMDQKQNAIVTASTPVFRKWLRTAAVEAMFGARAVFKRRVGGPSSDRARFVSTARRK